MAQSAGFYILLYLRYIISHIKHGAVSQNESEVLSQEKLELSQPKTGLAGPIQNGQSKRRNSATGQRDQKEDR